MSLSALYRPRGGACRRAAAAVLLGYAVAGIASPVAGDPDPVRYTEVRAPCDQRSVSRNAYFGDLHIHTAYSYDARPLGTRTTPADAYRFARGEPLGIPPYDAAGAPSAVMQLARPLDFAAVTDHSEFFGEMTLCHDPSSAAYEAEACRRLREDGARGLSPMLQLIIREEPQRIAAICGEDGSACRDAAPTLWALTQDMAETAYDRSADCTFTSFVGYEYTGTPNSNNIHRNVIFRNATVPERAVSYVETPGDVDLWTALRAECLEGLDDCEVLAIPHNANLSAGAMFPAFAGRTESSAADATLATLRNELEPIMEVFQHKGNSECFNGFPDILGAPDELCDMEQVLSLGPVSGPGGADTAVRFCEDGEVGRRGFLRLGCISKRDFYRSVLLTGLEDREAIGVNSYRLGVIGSTDTHMSLSGATDEADYRGHLVTEVDPAQRLAEPVGANSLAGNPGGLAGVWAVENSRDALFEAMQRREVFGTSGTRIKPRLFAGWGFASDACERGDRDAHGYNQGVPMGGDLAADAAAGAPQFLAYAQQDPLAAPLERLQLIKGWLDDAGQSHYSVTDVAGGPGGVAADATPPGHAALCALVEDPAFDPAQAAYYYLRVVEVPSPRWSSYACASLSAAEQRSLCDDNGAPATIRELAWTSPIWYLPREQ